MDTTSDKELIEELKQALDAEQVSMASTDRAVYSRDVWPRNTIRLGRSGFSSTERSFDSIRVFRVSKKVLSFSVSFMFHHHNRLALLPDVDQPGCGQVQDGHKPPYAVPAAVLIKWRDPIEAHSDRLRVGPHVRLVAVQIHARGRGRRMVPTRSQREAVQGIHEAQDRCQLRWGRLKDT